MGLDIHVRMVIGYKVEYRRVKSKVIRYNEENGNAYEKIFDEIKCSEEKIPEGLYDFIFVYPSENEEYSCIRGESLYYSMSHRNVNDPIDLFIPVCMERINQKLSEMKEKYPYKDINIYIYPDANW